MTSRSAANRSLGNLFFMHDSVDDSGIFLLLLGVDSDDTCTFMEGDCSLLVLLETFRSSPSFWRVW